jgi:hypothetical protein
VPEIKWESNVGIIVYGETIEESIFSARAIYQDADGDDYSPDGTYVYTYSGTASGSLTTGLKLGAGSYTLTATFDPEDSALGSDIAGTASLTVEKATPLVVWNNPPDITYGLDSEGDGPTLSTEQLNAIASTEGTFVYTPALDTELNAADVSQKVTATFTPSDEDNYKSLPLSEVRDADGNITQEEVLLEVEFKVLKGDAVIECPIFKNGLYEKILLPKGRFEEFPQKLDFDEATGGVGVKAKNGGQEIVGSFQFNPPEGTELKKSENVTITFVPDDINNWNPETLVKIVVYPVHERISGPLKAPEMFGCSVQSVSSSVGWGGNSSTCDLVLVEDPNNDLTWKPPPVGTACFFQYAGFYFGGIFTRWTYSNTTGGKTYKVLLESPAKLLDGVHVIMDSFEGTEYNFDFGEKYNRFRPSSVNPNITTEVNNVYNALGHFENYSFTREDGVRGNFGGSDSNSVGFPANKLLRTLEKLSCPDENEGASFAHKCAFGPQEYYKIDLSEISAIAPEYYRFSGVSQSINSLISDVGDLVQHDYFITVVAKDPETIVDEDGNPVQGGFELIDPIIKVKSIDKGQPPTGGVVRSLVESFKSGGVLMSSSIGEELTDDTTQKIVLGGPASRLVTRRTDTNSYPIWAKKQDSKYMFDFQMNPTGLSYLDDNKIPVWVDPFSYFSSYEATVFELRMATGGRDSWQTFKVFESVANGKYEDDPWCVDIDIDEGTLRALAAGNRGAMSLASTSLTTAKKGYDTDFANSYAREAKDYTEKIWAAVQNVASSFYGKMFALRMPEEPGGIDNNLRFITEDQKYETSWEALDSSFDPANRFSDVAFFDSSGRTKTYVEWSYSGNRDFSVLGSQYAGYTGNMFTQNFDRLDNIGQGVASAGCSIEKSAYFFNFGAGDKPFVVMNAGQQIKEYDDITTPDFGLTVLAKRFFDIDIPPENYIGPGKPNTQIAIPPKVVPPFSFGVSQQSNRYVWGPWRGGSLAGKSEVISEESLVPETFGSVAGMNEAGESLAQVGTAALAASETGYVELAEFPAYNIAERFAGGGPYVTDMSFTIDTSGFKTTYKFNTWTPQFGKLAKYNVDRISRINKASLELAKRERDKITKRPFLPIKQESRMEQLAKRQNRPNMGFSLAQIFPPGGNFAGTSEVSSINISDAAAQAANNPEKFNRMAGNSEDAKMVPVETRKNKDSENEEMSSLEKVEVTDEPVGGVLPSGEEADPVFSTAVHGDDGSEMMNNNHDSAIVSAIDDDPTSDLNPEKMEESERKSVNRVRYMAYKLPMTGQGWGWDIAYNPVPNIDGDLRSHDPNFQTNPKLMKSGPIRFLWDKERKVWSGGPEILCGTLATDITAAPSVLSPSNFTVNVLRKTGEEKGEGALEDLGEIITCYNRDVNLTATAGANVFIVVARLNYEWTPLWVSCTE